MIMRSIESIFMRFFRFLKNSFEETLFRIRFKLFARKSIGVFLELAVQHKWELFPIFGTLLGTYRENDFIMNDDDIDFAVNEKHMDSNLIKVLESNGFLLTRTACTDDMAHHHFAFFYKGIPFDLHGFTSENGKQDVISIAPVNEGSDQSHQMNQYSVILIHLGIERYTKGSLSGIPVNIPANTDEILRGLYGDDYMTPIEGKKTSASPLFEFLPSDKVCVKNVGAY